MSNSSFNSNSIDFASAEKLETTGATCDCYRMKLYGRQHFVKRLKPELLGDPRYMALLQKEFETGYSLEHPHLIKYVQKGNDYIITEYVDGETLTDFIHNHHEFFKKKSNRKKIISQLLSVIEYLHSHQVLHLDLKPSNMMITRIGHDLKLIDLGFSYTDSFPDTTGHTIPYAAPEQLEENGKTDERTDIFAIGKIMEAIPYAGSMKRVAERCTRKELEKRYQNIGEIRDVLKRKTVVHWTVAAICLLVVSAIPILLSHSHKPSDIKEHVIGDSIKQISSKQEVNTDSIIPEESTYATTISNTDTVKTKSEDIQMETPSFTPSLEPIPVATPVVAVETPAPEVVETNTKKPKKSKEGYYIGGGYDIYLEKDANLFRQMIQEFRNEIYPHGMTMITWHIDHGGIRQGTDGSQYVDENEQYEKLRQEYENYFEPIKTKIINKYGRKFKELDPSILPDLLEIAIDSELGVCKAKMNESLNAGK